MIRISDTKVDRVGSRDIDSSLLSYNETVEFQTIRLEDVSNFKQDSLRLESFLFFLKSYDLKEKKDT